MDLQKRAKIQSEQELEPSKGVGERFIAGNTPSAAPQDSSASPSQDWGAGAAREEKIRERAYAIWLDQGQCDGRDQEHWQEAEREIDAEKKSL